MVDMAHIAGLVAACEHESPVPYADFVTTTTHKNPARPAGGMILCKEQYAKEIDKAVFPGIQGGPLMHVIAAKAICLKRSVERRIPRLCASRSKNAQALARLLGENENKYGFGRHG